MLKLTYSNLEFQNFPGEDPRTPSSKGGEGKGREGRGGEGGESEGKEGGEGYGREGRDRGGREEWGGGGEGRGGEGCSTLRKRYKIQGPQLLWIANPSRLFL